MEIVWNNPVFLIEEMFMKLRWLVKKYPQPTVEDKVKAIREAKAGGREYIPLVSRPDEKILQVLDYDLFNSEEREYGLWVDVPVVVSYVYE